MLYQIKRRFVFAWNAFLLRPMAIGLTVHGGLEFDRGHPTIHSTTILGIPTREQPDAGDSADLLVRRADIPAGIALKAGGSPNA